LTQVAAANAEQIQRKKLLAQQELEEEARIADYIRRKDAHEQVGLDCMLLPLRCCCVFAVSRK
jgi:hypothetical protein